MDGLRLKEKEEEKEAEEMQQEKREELLETRFKQRLRQRLDIMFIIIVTQLLPTFSNSDSVRRIPMQYKKRMLLFLFLLLIPNDASCVSKVTSLER